MTDVPIQPALWRLLAAWLICAPAFAGDPPAGEPGGPGLAIRAAKILTAAREGPQVIDHGRLLIKDGRIQALGSARDLAVPEGYRELDVGRHWLMPGIIELHSHIGTTGAIFPGDINDSVYLTNPGIRASATVIPDNPLLRRGLAGGVTSALFIPGSGSNMGGQGVLFKLGHDSYEKMLIRDPGSLKLAQAGNPEGWTVGVNRTFMNWNTRNTFRRGLAYARRWEDYESERGPKPEKDLQWEIFRHLHQRTAQVSTHTQFYQVVLMTITMVREELGLDVFIDHGSFDGYRAAGRAARMGVPAILGPRMIATHVFVQHPLVGTIANDTDGAILGIAAEYQARGHTRIGFNTDCVDNGALGITPPQEELPLQAGMAVRYGLRNDHFESVRGLTIIPAETVGLGNRIGSLEPGKDADVLVVTGDMADPRNSVEMVLTDGMVVYDTGRERRRW